MLARRSGWIGFQIPRLVWEHRRKLDRLAGLDQRWKQAVVPDQRWMDRPVGLDQRWMDCPAGLDQRWMLVAGLDRMA